MLSASAFSHSRRPKSDATLHRQGRDGPPRLPLTGGSFSTTLGLIRGSAGLSQQEQRLRIDKV